MGPWFPVFGAEPYRSSIRSLLLAALLEGLARVDAFFNEDESRPQQMAVVDRPGTKKLMEAFALGGERCSHPKRNLQNCSSNYHDQLSFWLAPTSVWCNPNCSPGKAIHLVSRRWET